MQQDGYDRGMDIQLDPAAEPNPEHAWLTDAGIDTSCVILSPGQRAQAIEDCKMNGYAVVDLGNGQQGVIDFRWNPGVVESSMSVHRSGATGELELLRFSDDD